MFPVGLYGTLLAALFGVTFPAALAPFEAAARPTKTPLAGEQSDVAIALQSSSRRWPTIPAQATACCMSTPGSRCC